MNADVAVPEEVIGYATIQFHRGGFLDGRPTEDVIHLVRRTRVGRRTGTPGPTLCGRGRFQEDRSAWAAMLTAPWNGDGWSVDGGITEAHVEYAACRACVALADPELPLSSRTWRRLFANPEMER